ncbi:MAG: RNA 2',3'-cyclic phosphodiesterase [Candidatus Fervidibacter sp.]|uniref:RNA 2',3'-cyclic phosphodiesterase n=1 Tax=Candidatus Fervidibacter sp. TaxID=3100871 RepID=UPI0040492778
MAIRSFIALEISEDVREQLASLLMRLHQTNAAVKWVELENLHLTLKFLGEISSEQVEVIAETLGQVARSVEPFPFTVKGVGGFPDLRRPRVLWVGVEATPSLMNLQRLVEQAMEGLGFAPEGRSFHPHITLGRVKAMTGIDKVKAILSEHSNTEFGVVLADRLVLFRSDLSREGPTYTPIAVLPFAKPSP